MNEISLGIWIVIITLPFIAAFHRYAASYGYRGESHQVAFGEAWRVGIMIAMIETIFIIIKIS